MALNRKGITRLSVFLFFVLLIAWLAFGERGVIHLYKMEGQREQYRQRIQQLEKKNYELIREIESLRTDEAYIESVARHELNLLKEDEVQFRILEKPGNGLTAEDAWSESLGSGPEMSHQTELNASGEYPTD